jgi:two-component system CheB/CheR fusion protein
VLVIDDDADSREVTAAFLQTSGFVVEEYESAEAAISHVEGAAIVLTDITLPGMNGYEFAKLVRSDARTKDVMLFALSGRSDATPEQTSLFDRVIVKPFDPDGLVNLLQGVAAARTGSRGKRERATKPPPASDDGDERSHPPLDLIQYRLLIEHSPTLVWRAGIDAKCNYFNETWLAFTGRTLDQEFGDGWAEGVHPDDFQRCLAIYLEHFRRREPFEMEYRLRRNDGVYRTIFDRGVPFCDDAGQFAGFIGSCVDVEDRAQADRAKTTFLGMMAHELRTPLTPLRAYQVQMQRAHARGEPISEDLIKRFARQVDRLTGLVEHLSDAARLSAQRPISLSLEPNDLSRIVRDATTKQKEVLSARRDTRYRPAIEVHGVDDARPVEGDRKRLEQMTTELLDNAIKFSSGGTIRVELETKGHEHHLVVQDEGIGIPPEELHCIGRPYFRASNASAENYPGIGLGLAVATEVANAHGGSLVVAADHGVKVTVTLPERAEGAG